MQLELEGFYRAQRIYLHFQQNSLQNDNIDVTLKQKYVAIDSGAFALYFCSGDYTEITDLQMLGSLIQSERNL